MPSYDFAALRELQTSLASQVELTDRIGQVRLVAGTDLSAGPYTSTVWASVVLFRFPELAPVAAVSVYCEEPFPYRTGLLAFREVPPLLRAFERLPQRPDLVLADGHGLAHPRRFGIACHLGVSLDIPTLGCGKSRLLGEPERPLPDRSGASVALIDRGEKIGCLLRTKKGCNPVYVSTGHRVSPETAVEWVMRLSGGYRLPLPLREAHRQANLARLGQAPSVAVRVERVIHSSE